MNSGLNKEHDPYLYSTEHVGLCVFKKEAPSNGDNLQLLNMGVNFYTETRPARKQEEMPLAGGWLTLGRERKL